MHFKYLFFFLTNMFHCFFCFIIRLVRRKGTLARFQRHRPPLLSVGDASTTSVHATSLNDNDWIEPWRVHVLATTYSRSFEKLFFLSFLSTMRWSFFSPRGRRKRFRSRATFLVLVLASMLASEESIHVFSTIVNFSHSVCDIMVDSPIVILNLFSSRKGIWTGQKKKRLLVFVVSYLPPSSSSFHFFFGIERREPRLRC